MEELTGFVKLICFFVWSVAGVRIAWNGWLIKTDGAIDIKSSSVLITAGNTTVVDKREYIP